MFYSGEMNFTKQISNRHKKHRPEIIKVKDCPMYEQLCTIFTESAADGKYAQSSHYEQQDKPAGTNRLALNSCPVGGSLSTENLLTKTKHGSLLSSGKMMKAMVEREKEKQHLYAHPSIGQSSTEQEAHLIMAEALLDMLEASKVRTAERIPREDRFSVTNCIGALDEIESIDNQLYFAALDLFEDSNFREAFISLKGNQSI